MSNELGDWKRYVSKIMRKPTEADIRKKAHEQRIAFAAQEKADKEKELLLFEQLEQENQARQIALENERAALDTPAAQLTPRRAILIGTGIAAVMWIISR